MNQDFMLAIDQIAKSKGINRDKLFDAIRQSIEAACKKHFGNVGPVKPVIRVDINEQTGDVKVYSVKRVVEDEDVLVDIAEISVSDAKKINPIIDVDDVVDVEITPRNFGRIAAQNAKQVVIQKIKEAEREMVYNEYSVRLNDLVKGQVLRKDKNGFIIQLDHTEASLPLTESIPNETFEDIMGEQEGLPQKAFYLLNVKDFNKNEQRPDGKQKGGAQVIVSRTHPDLVKRLFEQEVVEIKEGTVVIKSIAREAGSRTKIAVHSNDPNVDPVGACVGEKGKRISLVVEELNGEKIDVVRWSEEPKEFIEAALSPAKVLEVALEETETERGTERSAKVIVPENILTLAIGKGGQNVRLAAKLTGWKIDIKSQPEPSEGEEF
ncbi:transcription termination factor NusA [Niameybacter massiliensis]|uniref:Transcription termination/antitermination protein NusA n=1 Tax=Holtiella tumoricola TaxID=3018743 RepID=A0AA42DPC2_9FIRM|nr:transcription termination factor NusA [Holtiella tumoricola]MDA3732627.1 transcription termination factor NusA [Holtiella tumoricola]